MPRYAYPVYTSLEVLDKKQKVQSSYFGLTEIVIMIIIENIRVTSLAIELLSMLALFKQFLKY